MNTWQKAIKAFGIFLSIFIIISIARGVLYTVSLIENISDFGVSKSRLFEGDYDNISNIKINTTVGKITIKKGETYKVEGRDIPKSLRIDYNNNQLEIEDKKRYYFNFNKTPEITIYIPENQILNKIELKNGAGITNINNINAQELDLENGVGQLNIRNTKFENINIETGVGETIIESSHFNNLKLETGAGRVDMTAKLTGETVIETGVGQLLLNLLGNKEDYQIETEKGIGSISINGDSSATNYGVGQNKIKIESGIGSIKINLKEEN